MHPSSDESAKELLEVVPLVMREIRSQMRSRASKYLTVPQFRALSFVERNSGSPLSSLAAFMGLTLPSASRLVDDFTARGLMSRREHPVDRRRVRLTVTRRGLSILEASRRETLSYLSERIKDVDDSDREAITRAMRVLQGVFSQQPSRNGTEQLSSVHPASSDLGRAG